MHCDMTSMTTYAIHDECRSDWSHQVSAVATTQWLQHDQTLNLSAKGVACESRCLHGQYWIRSLTSERFTFKLSAPCLQLYPPSLSPTSTSHLADVIYAMNDSRSCLLLVTLLLFCVVVKANQRINREAWKRDQGGVPTTQNCLSLFPRDPRLVPMTYGPQAVYRPIDNGLGRLRVTVSQVPVGRLQILFCKPHGSYLILFCIRAGELYRFVVLHQCPLYSTCHLNCHYPFPSNDIPTFNGRGTVDLPNISSVCQ